MLIPKYLSTVSQSIVNSFFFFCLNLYHQKHDIYLEAKCILTNANFYSVYTQQERHACFSTHGFLYKDSSLRFETHE